MARNQYIDYLKGTLILFVTIGHSLQFALYQNSNFWDDPVFKFIYIFHMPLFIGVSGYLSYSSIQKRDAFTLIFNRARSYIVPIFAWSTLFQLYLFLSTGNSSLANLAIDIIKYSTQTLWFLWALFGCLVFTILIKKISKQYFWPLYLASFPLCLLIPEEGNIHLFKYVYPFYQIGFFLASKPFIHIKPIYFILTTILTLLFYLVWNYETYIYITKMELSISNIENIISRYIAGGVACITISGLTYLIFNKSNALTKRIFSILGKYTLQLYIIQNFMFMIVLHYSKIYFTTPSNYLLLLIYTLLVTFIMSIFCILVGNLISNAKFLDKILFGNIK